MSQVGSDKTTTCDLLLDVSERSCSGSRSERSTYSQDKIVSSNFLGRSGILPDKQASGRLLVIALLMDDISDVAVRDVEGVVVLMDVVTIGKKSIWGAELVVEKVGRPRADTSGGGGGVRNDMKGAPNGDKMPHIRMCLGCI